MCFSANGVFPAAATGLAPSGSAGSLAAQGRNMQANVFLDPKHERKHSCSRPHVQRVLLRAYILHIVGLIYVFFALPHVRTTRQGIQCMHRIQLMRCGLGHPMVLKVLLRCPQDLPRLLPIRVGFCGFPRAV